MTAKDDTIGALLVAAGLVTETQLKAAVAMNKIMPNLMLGQIFVRFGGPGQPFPKIEDHQIELLIAEQKHGRANGRPLVESGAAIHSLKAAGAALDASTRTLKESGEASRKITLNEDLGPIDASQEVGEK